ncbi:MULTISPECIES: CPBP family intramembrane glutamic endopeptidase [unclassified Isoptericola]|uniref:CPBP family intramembrane glutamic endopeptidase n=1 Tax=unclassified Isoptericola TaxID=2623355 RepID=UPI0036648EB4
MAVLVGYLVIVVVVAEISGVPFDEVGASAESIYRVTVPSFVVGAVYLVAVTTALGWWRPALHDRHPSARRWPVVVPVLMAMLALVSFAQTEWSAFDASFLIALLLLGVGVGFCEELAARGVLLVALRSRYREAGVWLLSTLLFGAMHLANTVSGLAPEKALLQALIAAGSGTVFYILRRVTGSLVWSMVLHGLWDVSVFTVNFVDDETVPVAGLATPLIGLLGLAVVAWVIRGADERTASDATPAVEAEGADGARP